jgi:hypothetical protein
LPGGDGKPSPQDAQGGQGLQSARLGRKLKPAAHHQSLEALSQHGQVSGQELAPSRGAKAHWPSHELRGSLLEAAVAQSQKASQERREVARPRQTHAQVLHSGREKGQTPSP